MAVSLFRLSQLSLCELETLLSTSVVLSFGVAARLFQGVVRSQGKLKVRVPHFQKSQTGREASSQPRRSPGQRNSGETGKRPPPIVLLGVVAQKG